MILGNLMLLIGNPNSNPRESERESFTLDLDDGRNKLQEL